MSPLAAVEVAVVLDELAEVVVDVLVVEPVVDPLLVPLPVLLLADDPVVVVLLPAALLLVSPVVAPLDVLDADVLLEVCVAPEAASESATADGMEEAVDPESPPPQPARAIVTLLSNAGQTTRPTCLTFFMRPRKE